MIYFLLSKFLGNMKALRTYYSYFPKSVVLKDLHIQLFFLLSSFLAPFSGNERFVSYAHNKQFISFIHNICGQFQLKQGSLRGVLVYDLLPP